MNNTFLTFFGIPVVVIIMYATMVMSVMTLRTNDFFTQTIDIEHFWLRFMQSSILFASGKVSIVNAFWHIISIGNPNNSYGNIFHCCNRLVLKVAS